MTSSTKQKAIRAIIGALISGSFSETEIEEISRVFVDSSDFGTDLGALLKGVSESLRASKKFDKKALKPKQSRSAPLREALSLLEHIGISRKELGDILLQIDPGMASLFESNKLAVSDLLGRFFTANAEKADVLLNKLRSLPRQPTGPEDPYLKLIDKKLDK